MFFVIVCYCLLLFVVEVVEKIYLGVVDLCCVRNFVGFFFVCLFCFIFSFHSEGRNKKLLFSFNNISSQSSFIFLKGHSSRSSL